MLTKLRLKNWRSVKNAEIDLAPITVFIGANSSGKTNILDALRFLQDIRKESNGGIVGSVRYKWGGREKLRTMKLNRGCWQMSGSADGSRFNPETAKT